MLFSLPTYRSIFYCLSAALFLSLVLPVQASAHNANQLPFVEINNQDAQIYPVGYVSSPENFPLPQDYATGPFFVNQPVNFGLLPDNLPVSPDSISKITFKWDFGDTSPILVSPNASHTYTKIGTYLVSLQADNPADNSGLQVLDLIYLNILPNKDYVLPTSIINVNGQKISPTNHPIVKVNLDQTLSLDGSTSHGGSSPLKSFLWDGGNEKMSTQAVFNQTYGSGASLVQPVLRVTDHNGFWVDTPVLLEHDASVKNTLISAPPTPEAASGGTNNSTLRIVSIVVAILALIWVGVTTFFPKKKKGRR